MESGRSVNIIFLYFFNSGLEEMKKNYFLLSLWCLLNYKRVSSTSMGRMLEIGPIWREKYIIKTKFSIVYPKIPSPLCFIKSKHSFHHVYYQTQSHSINTIMFWLFFIVYLALTSLWSNHVPFPTRWSILSSWSI